MSAMMKRDVDECEQGSKNVRYPGDRLQVEQKTPLFVRRFKSRSFFIANRIASVSDRITIIKRLLKFFLCQIADKKKVVVRVKRMTFIAIMLCLLVLASRGAGVVAAQEV
jgi:hypothetical protein